MIIGRSFDDGADAGAELASEGRAGNAMDTSFRSL